jgi:hypothetical protein
MASPTFDVFVMVDWSSASVPTRGKDSIWAATLDVVTGETTVENHPTRRQASGEVRRILHGAAGRRVLVGFDFPYGYPAGFAAALGLPAPPWRSVWRELVASIEDDARNRNNRFDVASRLNGRLGGGNGPFWGRPASRPDELLSTHKLHTYPLHGLAEYRHAEARLRSARRQAFSVWQTCYAGSVGGQALVGIPVLERLLTDDALGPRTQVWPFTTGFVADPTGGRDETIVHAEIWPGAIDVDLGLHPVRDAAQVLSLCRWAADLDRAGALGPLFAPSLPDEVSATAVAEEGWILGVV